MQISHRKWSRERYAEAMGCGAQKVRRASPMTQRTIDPQCRLPWVASCRRASERTTKATDIIDTIRLFEDLFDFTDGFGDGWSMLLVLGYRTTETEADPSLSTSHWLLRTFKSSVEPCFSDGVLTSLLAKYGTVIRCHHLLSKMEFNCLTSSPKHDTTFHVAAVCSRDAKLVDLESRFHTTMATNNFDLHITASGTWQTISSPLPETPTLLAIYNEETFYSWRYLYVLPNLYAFVEDELQQRPLVDRGWETDTLTALFQLDLQPKVSLLPDACGKCSRTGPLAQISWLERLERLKMRIGSDWEAYCRLEQQPQEIDKCQNETTDLASSANCYDNGQDGVETKKPLLPDQPPTKEDFICVWCWHGREP